MAGDLRRPDISQVKALLQRKRGSKKVPDTEGRKKRRSDGASAPLIIADDDASRESEAIDALPLTRLVPVVEEAPTAAEMGLIEGVIDELIAGVELEIPMAISMEPAPKRKQSDRGKDVLTACSEGSSSTGPITRRPAEEEERYEEEASRRPGPFPSGVRRWAAGAGVSAEASERPQGEAGACPPTVTPSLLEFPEGWPEADPIPGVPDWWSVDEEALLDEAAERSSRGLIGQFRGHISRVFKEAARWRRLAHAWEAKCGESSELAEVQGKQLSRLMDEREGVEQVSLSQTQQVKDLEQELKNHRERSLLYRSQIEGLKSSLSAARLEPESLRKELSDLRSVETGLRAQIAADSEAAQAKIERLQLSLTEARSEPETLRREVADLHLVVEELREEKAQIIADSEFALQERDRLARGEVEGLKASLSDSHRAMTRKEEELSSLRQSYEGRLERAVQEFRASDAYGVELAEAGVYSYEAGFAEGLSEVKKVFPDLDLSNIALPPGDDADQAGSTPGSPS